MPNDRDDDQLVADCDCGKRSCSVCHTDTDTDTEVETWWDKARAGVVFLAGVSAVLTPPLILYLQYADSLRRAVPYVPDERLLLAMLAAFGSVFAYAWRTKQ